MRPSCNGRLLPLCRHTSCYTMASITYLLSPHGLQGKRISPLLGLAAAAKDIDRLDAMVRRERRSRLAECLVKRSCCCVREQATGLVCIPMWRYHPGPRILDFIAEKLRRERHLVCSSPSLPWRCPRARMLFRFVALIFRWGSIYGLELPSKASRVCLMWGNYGFHCRFFVDR